MSVTRLVPFNAVLNYGYTLLEVKTQIASEIVGLDPDFGLLRVDGRLRESFIYDLREPLRTKADVSAVELFHKEKLNPAMLRELRDGMARLDPDLTQRLATVLMPRFAKAAIEMANDRANQLGQITVARKLVREGPKPIAARRKSRERLARGYCKEPLARKGLTYCRRNCYLRYSIEFAKPIEKTQQRLAELRSRGLSPGHGGAAARKRAPESLKTIDPALRVEPPENLTIERMKRTDERPRNFD